MASVWGELVRRNVVKVGIAYAVVAWTLIQVIEVVFPRLNLPDWGVTMVIVLLIVFAPVALFLAWAYELTPSGIQQTGPTLSRRQVLTGAAGLGLLGVGVGAGAWLHARMRPLLTPKFHRLSYRRGMIRTARFTPDYQSVLYGALWDGDDCRVYSVRPPNVESAPLGLAPAMPLAVSSTGELAIALGGHQRGVMTYGTLARVPLAGGAPRELVENVKYADWSPDGSELAIVRRDGNRDLLEFPIGTVLAESAPVAWGGTGGFSFPRVSLDGQRVAFFDLSRGLAGTVAVVDRAGVKTTLTPEFLNLFGLAWKGDEIWFSAAEESYLLRDSILAVKPGGDVRRVTRLVGNISLHDIAPDGRVLLAYTDDRAGVAVQARSDTGERDLSWLDAPSLADISADGRSILFNEWGVGGGASGSVYVRATDGSPAVRLGDGAALALSPDGRWALRTTGTESGMELIPTGAGETRAFERPGYQFGAARWLPDGGRVIVSAAEPGRQRRLYALDLANGDLQSITPEHPAFGWAVSPDGALVAVSVGSKVKLYPTAGGAAQDAPDLGSEERLLGWINDGLLVSSDPTGLELGRLWTIDLASGARALWRDIRPLDPAGLMFHGMGFAVTPDGQSYAYTWHRALSVLFTVEGLA